MGPHAPRLTCPFCDSPDVEDVAQWGGQIITRQCRCRACATYFEAVREDFDAPQAAAPAEADASDSRSL
jgi:formate dehydrogenase maturation protein FdhE